DFARSAERSTAPRRNSSAYPRMDVSGVRSSWDASARNRRSRSSDAVRSAKACSIWASIALSATPNWPTSVLGSCWGTLLVRSPSAIAPAVTPDVGRVGALGKARPWPPRSRSAQTELVLQQMAGGGLQALQLLVDPLQER